MKSLVIIQELVRYFVKTFQESINNSSSTENSSDNNQLIVCLANGEICDYDFDEEEIYQGTGYNEEMNNLQRLQNEKKVILAQIEKCMIESTNRKKVN